MHVLKILLTFPLALFLTVTSLVSAQVGSQGVAVKLTLGAVLHLSGEWAREGNAFREGIELGAEELGSQGFLLTLKIEDSQFVGRSAATAAQKLINQDQVQALIISSLSEAKYCSSQFEPRRIPTVVLWDAAPELDALGEYVFGIGAWAPGTGQRAARYAYETLGIRKVAVVNNSREWSQSAAKYFREEFARLGGSLVFNEELAPGESEFRGLSVRLRSSRAEMLYAPLEDNLVPTLKALWQAKAVARMMTSDVLSADFLKALGPAAEGMYYTQLREPTSEARTKLDQLYRRKHARAPELLQFNAWGYDAIHLLAKAATESSQHGVNLKDVLARTSNYSGASGTISFSSGGSVQNYPAVYVVKNGAFEFLSE